MIAYKNSNEINCYGGLHIDFKSFLNEAAFFLPAKMGSNGGKNCRGQRKILTENLL